MSYEPRIHRDWKHIVDQLGCATSLEASARRTRVLVRARAIGNAVDLLRMILAYCFGEGGLRSTAAWASAIGLVDISDPDIENGQSGPTVASRSRRDIGPAIRKGQRQRAAVDERAFDAAAFQSRRGRACQQNGADCLGAADQGRDLSQTWDGRRRGQRLNQSLPKTN